MRSLLRRSRRARRAFIGVSACALLALVFLVVPAGGPASALAATLSTPYPAMTVQAGQTVSVSLTLKDTASERMDLSVSGAPAGWKATILGAGHPVSAVMTDPDNPSSLELQVVIPSQADEATSTLTVTARSSANTVSLPISLTVSKSEGGTTTVDADYSSLRGPTGASFTFSLTLHNNSAQARTYNLSAKGPDGWTVSLKRAGASQESPTVTVEAGGSQGLTLDVTPATDAEAKTYDLDVTIVGGGDTVSTPLQVEITGTYKLTLTTPDGRLNADVKAGGTTKVQFVVTNSGTGPLQNVHLSATAPANWDVTFSPSTIDTLPANQQQNVTASFTPAKDSIAGDYVVTMSAKADQANTTSDIRVAVKTSTLWGVIGVLIAVAAIAILALVFRRFGHR